MQILEYHVYAKDAFEVSDFKDHNSLVTKEGESLKVKHLSSALRDSPSATVIVQHVVAP